MEVKEYKTIKVEEGKLKLELGPGLAFWEHDGGVAVDGAPFGLPIMDVDELPLLIEFLLIAYKRLSSTPEAIALLNNKKHEEFLLASGVFEN